MEITNNTNTSEVKPTTILDTLCTGFEGGSFYGLEYVLDDFFEDAKERQTVTVRLGFDWFGLDS